MTSRYALISLKDLSPGCGTLMPIIYGIVVPIIALFVISVDSVIITVFTRPHVRSHTTYILTLIALADICNITPPTVIYVYYYTLGNYHYAIPYHLCRWTYMLSDVCHDLFNAISLWLTVLLAYIRCRCLKTPFDARCLHKCKNITLFVLGIILLELILHVPSMFILNYHPVTRTDANNITVSDCAVSDIDELSTSRKIHLWSEVLVDSLLPSLMLLYLDFIILATLRQAKKSRNSLRSSRSYRSSCTRSKSRANCRTDQENSQSKIEYQNGHHQTNGNDRLVDRYQTQIYDKQCVQTIGHDLEKDIGDVATDNCCFDHKYIWRAKRKRITRFEKKVGCCCLPLSGKRKKRFFVNKQPSVDTAFDKLDRESRRTSWLILAVAALITTHELPSALLHVLALAKYSDTALPVSIFGCWSAFLNLWQYVIYPIIFLIYAWMSSIFRHEMCKVLKCIPHHDDDELPGNKRLFLSPCSVRKTMSKEETTMHHSDSDPDEEV